MCSSRRWRKPAIRGCPPSSASGGGGAAGASGGKPRADTVPGDKRRLSTADLVVLSLLAEGPMHGYQVNAELQRRQVRDWADISRPQIYYSLEKLATLGLLRRLDPGRASGGPERRRFAASAAGLARLAEALASPGWSTAREKPPFLTWMALSWRARKGVFGR